MDSPPDFIAVFPNAVPADVCRAMVAKFEASGAATRGRVGSGIEITLKDSFDIGISGNPAWAEESALFHRVMAAGLMRYLREYPHLLVGPLSPRTPDPATGTLRPLLASDVPALSNDALLGFITRLFRPGAINLQKYQNGVGGYPHWHSEVFPKGERCEPLHRVLLWTVYLNDVPEAGETEFFYQQRKVAPRAGTLLIAPAGFTHTHRGKTPIGADKYIATSWVLFERAEQLYGGVR